jgi:Co/Zn/Cd efflux system component
MVLVIIVTLCFFFTCSVTFWMSSSSVLADACHLQA